MLPDTFRLLALGLPNVQYGSSLGNEEYRVGSKVFATVGSPMVGQAVLRLTPQDQARFMALAPHTFAPKPGGQGARGVTIVKLATAEGDVLREALVAGWKRASGKD